MEQGMVCDFFNMAFKKGTTFILASVIRSGKSQALSVQGIKLSCNLIVNNTNNLLKLDVRLYISLPWGK